MNRLIMKDDNYMDYIKEIITQRYQNLKKKPKTTRKNNIEGNK